MDFSERELAENVKPNMKQKSGDARSSLSDSTEVAKAASTRVGAILRRFRKESGISLQKLADLSGVSVGTISQVERDLANPSLRVLTNIRNALNLPASALFHEIASPPERDPGFVRRAAQRPRLELGYISKELLTAGTPHSLQLMILHIPAGNSSGDKMMRYPAEKAGLVLEGEIILTVGEEEARLQKGDSFVFDSSIAHGFSNPGSIEAKVLWIIGSVPAAPHF
jgi:transcriptional regulator with XRE-family HTH domain